MPKRKQHAPEIKAKVAPVALKGEKTDAEPARAIRWTERAGSLTTSSSSGCGER